ncbi:hypothetical protein [Alienimonas californiensis]|uniref:PASTA domain-containing protein n=1 Tax=Alienimonas californiensis TaxID=2527989 RepID=A0A517PC57_9PLAN|nr:hypothetical protein [Alienimonas californiensis]QDT16963.1 hypothetical protein CA12_30730 [Alienimonas californiensis]
MPPATRPTAPLFSAGRSVVVRSALGVACIAVCSAALTAQESPAPQRPDPQAMRVDAVSPALQATLQAWYDATKDVQKLEGSHIQVLSDDSFRTEAHSVGKFFYEGPDKGRIDLDPRPESQCRPRARGAQAPYEVTAGEVKKWVCDGTKLMQIDEAKKEVTVTEIPPQHRGENIMNGPLPFLLGMPPEVVKRRFKISFPPNHEPPAADMQRWLADPNSTVMLKVLPLQKQDAQNWSEAWVELSKPDFLPKNVKLYAPGGGSDTMYQFHDLKTNDERGLIRKLFGQGDPFQPNLRGYKAIPMNVAGGPAPAGGDGAPQGPGIVPQPMPQVVPSVVGLPHATAEKLLVARNYAVKKYAGDPTETKALVGKVQVQQHEGGTKLPPGETVGLKIWIAAPAIRQAAAAE